MDPLQAILDEALSQNGVREAGTTNSGPEVDGYLASVGLPPGNPWCAAFVHWCVDRGLHQLGLSNPLPRTGYCPDLEHWAASHHVLAGSPSRGDVFLHFETVDGVYRAAHTGLVRAVNGSVFDTVEGNTNEDGSRQGIGVFTRERTTGPSYKFLQLSKVLPAATAPLSLSRADGTTATLQALVEGEQTLAPVRQVAEFFGHTVAWSAASGLTIDGQSFASVDRGGVAFAASRALADQLGLNVAWTDGKVVLST